MTLKYSNDDEKKMGWTLSFSYLLKVHKSIEDNYRNDDIPSLEQIEAVLLAHDRLDKGVVK